MAFFEDTFLVTTKSVRGRCFKRLKSLYDSEMFAISLVQYSLLKRELIYVKFIFFD